MTLTYPHLFFDLDHTLWDYERNCRITLEELYDSFSLEKLGLPAIDEFEKAFTIGNFKGWALYDEGKVNRDDLRLMRFPMIFAEMGLPAELVPNGLEEAFVEACPTKGALVEGCEELLEYALSKGYQLHIVSNGFKDALGIKVDTSNLRPYFQEVVSSECTPYRKPQRELFEYLFKKLKVNSSQCLMIGDKLESDILGAMNAGIDNVYFNPHKIGHNWSPTFEIQHLSELRSIL